MLEINAIDTYRGPAQILQRVSLTVRDRECVCLVGRNGAGKTTTIDSVIGLLPIRAGKVSFGGEVISRLPPHQRARRGIGYAPEDAAIFPDLTVAENIEICRWLAESSGRVKGTSDAETKDRSFAVFPEVKDFMQRSGLHLSGGQKKMVAIARAMALSPAILLLDEPFEGLAPFVVTRFIEAVKKIKSLGISTLIAASNLANAARVADRLYAIDRGEIIYEGEPQRAFENEELMKTIRG